MDWLFEPLPKTLGFVMGGFFTAAVLTIAVTHLRGTRLALLAGANMACILAWTLSLSYFEPAPWRLQVVVQRLVELPLISGLAVLCVLQARRLPLSEPRLAWALRSAPVLLAGAWALAFAGEQAWPRPILAPFAEIPVRNWVLLIVLCIPFQSYLWCNVFLFARSAGPRSPTRRIRMQNLSLAVSVGGYGLSSLNVLAGYSVLAFLDYPARKEVTLIQYAIEERLFLVWGPALLVGLLLAASPVASRAASRAADAFALLPLRERFEGLTWRLENVGALRRLTRPLYHLESAASDLGLSEADTAKAQQTVKLAAILGASKTPDGLSREKARELLDRLEANSVCRAMPVDTPSQPTRAPEAGPAGTDHLPEIIDAALDLSAQTTVHASQRRDECPTWFELARAACADAGITTEYLPASSECHRAFDAYHKAAKLVRSA